MWLLSQVGIAPLRNGSVRFNPNLYNSGKVCSCRRGCSKSQFTLIHVTPRNLDGRGWTAAVYEIKGIQLLLIGNLKELSISNRPSITEDCNFSDVQKNIRISAGGCLQEQSKPFLNNFLPESALQRPPQPKTSWFWCQREQFKFFSSW